jgi:hypothetical protein
MSEEEIQVKPEVKSENITIVIENLGAAANITIDPSATVAQLCDAYNAQTGVELPFVTLNQRRLSRHATLRDSGIVSGTVLIGSFHLVFQDKDFETETSLVVGPDDTLSAVIVRFREIVRRPILASTAFLFRDAKLEPGQTLAMLQLKHDDKITVATRTFDISLTYNGRRQSLTINRALSLRQVYDKVRAMFDLSQFHLETAQGSAPVQNSDMLVDETHLRPNTEIVVVSALDIAVQRLRYICHACGNEVRSLSCHLPANTFLLRRFP